jgi:Domain of unknown function (DUF397)
VSFVREYGKPGRIYMDLTRATWRKSTYSGNNGGNCVEITAIPDWRKSSLSSQNGSCVEVAAVGDGRPGHLVGVRDSKDPGGPVLALAPEQWRAFTGQVKAYKNLLA